jgi:YggT family protein
MAPKGRENARKNAISRRSSVGRHLRPRGWGVKASKPRRRLVPATVARYMFAKQTGLSMRAILDVILLALQIYVWLLIAAAVLSWLIAFNVVNTRNQFVATVGEFLYRITEPALRPIRNLMPNLGGIDISPVILILIIFLIERVIIYYIYPSAL